MKEIPKYMQKKLEQRHRLACKLADVCGDIDDYCINLGIKDESTNCFNGSVEIYVNPDVALDATTEAIINALNNIEDE